MDLNEAALRLKKIEVIESQIEHLNREAALSDNVDYCTDCHEKAQELCKLLKEFWL